MFAKNQLSLKKAHYCFITIKQVYFFITYQESLLFASFLITAKYIICYNLNLVYAFNWCLNKNYSKFEFLVQAQKQICNLMKFDSYPRFIKSELYKECLLRDISGQPLPLRGKPDANLQLHQNPPLHQSLSTNVSESFLILVQFINSIVICSIILILVINSS